MINVIETAIPGVVVIEPKVFGDARGYFLESWSQRDFDAQVRPVRFVQDNESKSSYGVLRGLHFQKGKDAQSKLVRVIKGRVLDVAVDIRRGSPTFGKHVMVELTGEHHRRVRARVCGAQRGGAFPVQVRQLVCAAGGGRHRLG